MENIDYHGGSGRLYVFGKENTVMMSKRISCLCILLLFVLGISSTCQAKSVFAVASHTTSKIKAYLIDPVDGKITLQATIEGTESFGAGATGLCAWPGVERLFVTYESSEKIAWASTKTLKRDADDEIDAPEDDLAGVIVDEQNDMLYVIGRNTGRLYTYEFDIWNDTLVLTYPDGQEYRELESLDNAYGMALDEDGGEPFLTLPTGLLYVADGTSTVRYYNTMTWELAGSVDMGRSAVGIACDGDGRLYAGGYFGDQEHDYLIRYDVNDDPNVIEKDMGYKVVDIVIDKDAGILYATTRQNVDGYRGAVEAYDVSDWSANNPNGIIHINTESDSDFSGPAGIGIGSQFKLDDGMTIEKIDDVDGFVLPGDYYYYDITFVPGPTDKWNVVLTDKLPEGVDFHSADPNDGTYYPQPDHKYVWEIGNVSGNDPNSYFKLTVQVNDHAEPAADLENIIEAESDASYVDSDENTPVGWWGGNVIYVDKNSPGPHIGTSWQTAYLYLEDALERADLASNPSEIEVRVADGTYKPGTAAGDFFDVPDYVEVYGGFVGYGAANPNERDWKKYETILSGAISDTLRNNTVVTMKDNSLLDGFTVEKGVQGIDASNISSTVAYCTIEQNVDVGINCENGNLITQWSEIKDNGEQGIYHSGSSYILTVENCNIHGNQHDGILTNFSISTILNSLIYQNGSGSDYVNEYYGINILNPSSSPDVYNNTIVNNTNEGIRFVGSNAPDVRNNILYYNNKEEQDKPQLAGISTTYYCCIYDSNGQSSTPDANGNITCEPDFVYDKDPYGFYHIKYESKCRNAGDDNAVGAGDVDMDNTQREQENIVDIGADEVSCEDTWSESDWTRDGVVNLEEDRIFLAAWLSHDPNDPVCDPGHPDYVSDPNLPDYITESQKEKWNPICNLNAMGTSEYVIDMADFAGFANENLWSACWYEDYSAVMYSMSGGGESMMMESSLMQELTVAYEPDPVSEGKALVEILDIVSEAIKEEPDNFEGLVELKAVLEDWLDKIPAQK